MKLYNRTFQVALKYGCYFLPIRSALILNNYSDIITKINTKKKVFLITDETILSLGLTNELENTLKDNNVEYTIYSSVLANPTISNIEDAFSIYRNNNCHSIIALGGGSVLDLAKMVAVKGRTPNRSIKSMKGILRIILPTKPVIAIPTTSGTGSETTLAAVVTDDFTHEKYAIIDPALTPHYTLLKPELTTGLPKSLTAYTGLDALTHAIESYIGRSNTRQTKKDALKAMLLIKDNLVKACNEPENLEYRMNMLTASYLAGKAFTRAFVGSVHSLAHALGGLYNLQHGLLNAIILPRVLNEYGESIYKKMGEIYDYLDLGNANNCLKGRMNRTYKYLNLKTATLDNQAKTKVVINWVLALNEELNIPSKINEIKVSDLDLLASRAEKETNPLYPVPVIWKKSTFKNILISVMERTNDMPYSI